MSPYSYCLNNPVSLIDPTGHRQGCAGGGYSINYARKDYNFMLYVKNSPAPIQHRSPAPELRVSGYGNPEFTLASGERLHELEQLILDLEVYESWKHTALGMKFDGIYANPSIAQNYFQKNGITLHFEIYEGDDWDVLGVRILVPSLLYEYWTPRGMSSLRYGIWHEIMEIYYHSYFGAGYFKINDIDPAIRSQGYNCYWAGKYVGQDDEWPDLPGWSGWEPWGGDYPIEAWEKP